MDALLIKSLWLMFILTGLFACLDAWLNKWGPALAMLGMCVLALTVGSLTSGSWFALIPGGLIVLFCAVMWRARNMHISSKQAEPEEDPKIVSERLLAQLNEVIAEKKRARGW